MVKDILSVSFEYGSSGLERAIVTNQEDKVVGTVSRKQLEKDIIFRFLKKKK